ncbi:probable G-protein coupled receptor 158 isoform X3 [Phlebotomus papatasi]|uniref:probable G-protein coupled receptor 158 isoform X3 n=1 Tax=Phlebotomus papatasi TaxID=29031 RepID=UPI002483BAE1|nr:probable G-protein coupled receptor 158 isoform X3 [Phlebotomus papatasi]
MGRRADVHVRPSTTSSHRRFASFAIVPLLICFWTPVAPLEHREKQEKTPPCEPRTLDESPPDPWYDASDITLSTARSLAEYLALKPTQNEVRQRANALAKSALKEDENFLAVAIAAPTVFLSVIQFRDQVDRPPHSQLNHSFLATYWRELGVAWNHTEGSQYWGVPFRDCGPLVGRWLWPFSVTIHEHGYKVVASSFIAADLDQCNDALEAIFGQKHGCDRETTFCLQGDVDVNSPRKGGYTCVCKQGFFVPNQTLQGFEGEKVESGSGNFSCIPCPGGCTECSNTGECLFGDEQDALSTETLFKSSIGAILGACMLCCFVLAVIVFRQRKCKTIATGMWTVLETILLGIILLYEAVALHFLPASTLRCLLEPWCRELGFVICYGAIILKLYRHLIEFRTRKAHRWVVRDLDLLKYLCAMIVAVLCYLSAFTASAMDFLEHGGLLGLEEDDTNTCRPLKWDYVTQAGEMFILAFGLHLGYASRNANTQFRERQFLVVSILIEFVVSSIFYTLRALYLPELSPGAIFLALFLRSQLTNTVTLGLIFLPKLWYQHKQVRSLTQELSCRLPVDAFKGSHDASHHGVAGSGVGGGGTCILGDPDIGDLSLSEMNPEDIRAELKRLYTQLEILKNKTLRQDNPHISKRRGGRKVAHRRFSLQALSAKHRSNRHNAHDMEVTEAEPSRTPEDSVCSGEGPTDTGGEMSALSVSK